MTGIAGLLLGLGIGYGMAVKFCYDVGSKYIEVAVKPEVFAKLIELGLI